MALSGVRSSWLNPTTWRLLALFAASAILLGFLQLGVGALVGLDLVHQQIGLAPRFLLGDAAAILREHKQPSDDAGDDDENEEHRPQRRDQDILGARRCRANQEIDERKNRADDAGEQMPARRDSGRLGIEQGPMTRAGSLVRTSRRVDWRCGLAACSNRGSAFPASSRASRSAPNKRGNAPCPRPRNDARKSSSGSWLGRSSFAAACARYRSALPVAQAIGGAITKATASARKTTAIAAWRRTGRKTRQCRRRSRQAWRRRRPD